MKCSIRVNEELACSSDENIHALFALSAACCCDTAVTSLYWFLTSSAGCLLRSWTRSFPTWTLPLYSPSVSPTSSSIGSPTRSECLAVKINICQGEICFARKKWTPPHTHTPTPPFLLAAALRGQRFTRQISGKAERRSRRALMSISWFCRQPQQWCKTSRWDTGRCFTSSPWLHVTHTSGKGIYEQSATTRDCPVKQSASYGRQEAFDLL